MYALKLRSPLPPPRREDATLLPAALVALLCGGAVVQVALTGGPDLPPAGVGRVAPVETLAGVPTVTPAPVIMARPLFAPTRTATGRPSAPGAADPGPLGGAIPAGMTARGRAARLFLRLPDGGIRVMAPGSVHMGWRLAGLSADAAIFRRGSQRLVVPYGQSAPAIAEDDSDSEEE